MLVQLVSAGGTFPWQTIPTPLWGLHRVLPMSYSVDGLRHLLYGGDLSAVGTDVAVLLACLAGALLLQRDGGPRGCGCGASSGSSRSWCWLTAADPGSGPDRAAPPSRAEVHGRRASETSSTVTSATNESSCGQRSVPMLAWFTPQTGHVCRNDTPTRCRARSSGPALMTLPTQ